MSDVIMSRISGAGAQPEARTRRVVGFVKRVARLMLARSRERHSLSGMDARMLRDIGLTPHEAGIEARKWFWQA